ADRFRIVAEERCDISCMLGLGYFLITRDEPIENAADRRCELHAQPAELVVDLREPLLEAEECRAQRRARCFAFHDVRFKAACDLLMLLATQRCITLRPDPITQDLVV